ncbi:hypothetical protein BC629DRAFT_1590832 [Irpex lacteus]|nr:hypothetical protein BC629DRAFT_1590832 [Irpex lacteus]
MVNLKSKAQDICKFQSDIARDASPAYANGSFKQKWTTLDPQKRREFVIEGLYQASCCCWLEERRGLCPEFTLTSLSGRGGGEYLRLLGIILQAAQASGSTTIKSPVLFPHPQVDYMWALPRAQSNIPGLQAWATDIILDRTLFGSAAIWYIFLAFHGQNAQLDSPRVSSYSTGDLEQVQRDPRACQHCGKSEHSMEPGRQLRACGRCLAVERRIYYCARECQSQNWRHGQPIPHRVICGKAVEADPNPEPRIRARPDTGGPRIPEPEPGFSRSSELLHQISFLSQPPYVDYTFIFPYPHADRGVTVRPSQDRRTFLTLREEALRSGNPEAVQTMYYMLIPFADSIGFSRGSLKKQLEREYDTELQELPHSWDANTAARTAVSDSAPQTNVQVDEINDDDFTLFPGTLETENNMAAAPSAADKLFFAGVYYVFFAFLSLGALLLLTKYLLRNPLLVICLAPFLGTIFRALSNAFKVIHEWVWQD